MRFCPKCSRCMKKDTSSGSIEFKCPTCMEKVAGDRWDRRIGGKIISSSETTGLYQKLLENAAFDRVNQLVRRDCKSCGLDYMTQIRVGDNETIIHLCKCGLMETGDKVTKIEQPSDVKKTGEGDSKTEKAITNMLKINPEVNFQDYVEQTPFENTLSEATEEHSTTTEEFSIIDDAVDQTNED
jgi:DNA-directed RNA polymerase subunit M/transcription elongation factor TFIIS